MIREGTSKEQEAVRETAIEDAIIAHPEELGFPEAQAIYHDSTGGQYSIAFPSLPITIASTSHIPLALFE
jgi:hypothetical protein